MFFDDIWLGFLCEQIIRRTESLSKLKCPGCEANLKSPLLHLHLQNSLLDKMRLYFEEIRDPILRSVPEMYEQIKDRLPHSEDLESDKESYITIGRQFLMLHSCDSMYFGRWITELNDSIIDECFRTNKKASAVIKGGGSRKRKAKGQLAPNQNKSMTN